MKALPSPSQPKSLWQKIKGGFKAIFIRNVYAADAQRENIERQISANYDLQQLLQENSQNFQRSVTKERMQFDAEKLKYQLEANADLQFGLQANSHQFQWQLEKNRQQLELTRLKIHYFMQLEAQAHHSRENQLNREHQSHENQLSREFQAELSLYMKKLDHAMMQEKMAFDLFLFEERRKLDLEMREVTHNFQLKLAAIHGEITRQTEEYKRTLDRYPWGVPASTILGIYGSYQDRCRPVPPLVILSPPTLEYDRFINPSSTPLPKIEKRLAEDVRTFLNSNYPLDDQLRPAHFIGGIWETKARHSENAVTLLFSLFSSVPTLIFECEIEGEFLNFRVASWDVGQEIYKYKSILSEFNYSGFLYDVARNHAHQWREQKAQLLQKGRTLEELKKLGGDDELNLGILEYEESLHKDGYDGQLNYKITPKAVQELVKHLRVLHCIFVGLALDEYYFMRYNVGLQLPKVLNSLIFDLPQYEQKNLLVVVTDYYKSLYEAIKSHESPFLPELGLDIIIGLANIVDKSWLEEMLNNSMRAWLKLRKVQPHKKMDLLNAMQTLWNRQHDESYVKQLYQCFTAIGNNHAAERIAKILEQWQSAKIKDIIL
ncbi:MAG: hypothetical protein RJA13_1225 [Bacteroidota bacterium]|jgi:hypothetical protein